MNSKEQEQIKHLRKLYDILEWNVSVLADPVRARCLMEAMGEYKDVFPEEIDRIRHQLDTEEAAQDLVAHIITVKDPGLAFVIAGLTSLEYRTACIQFYESKTPEERLRLLSLQPV